MAYPPHDPRGPPQQFNDPFSDGSVPPQSHIHFQEPAGRQPYALGSSPAASSVTLQQQPGQYDSDEEKAPLTGPGGGSYYPPG